VASPHSANGSRPAAESGGSGLGLAIVAAIAQAHGGQATLESAPGHGTRVRVWLPATVPAAPATPRAAAIPQLSRARHDPGPAAPATPQPSYPPSHRAGPPPRQPLSAHIGYPPPRQPLSAPIGYPARRQPLPGPADYPARPAQQSLPRPARYPPPMYAPPPGPPALAPPAPPLGDSSPGAAELHHDWGDPPQPVPPPGPPDPDAVRDGDGDTVRPTVAPWRQLPPPGRHGRVSGGPQPGDDAS
jgi:hypothetical protein